MFSKYISIYTMAFKNILIFSHLRMDFPIKGYSVTD